MRILLTGGAGYVAGILVAHVLARGHKGHILDSLMYGGRGLLPC
jgi:UDP-glucose 4-epimerase